MITFIDDASLPISYVNSVELSNDSAPLQGGALSKQNMMILIAVAVLVCVGVGLVLYFFVFAKDDDDAETTSLKSKSKPVQAVTQVAEVAEVAAATVAVDAGAEGASADKVGEAKGADGAADVAEQAGDAVVDTAVVDTAVVDAAVVDTAVVDAATESSETKSDDMMPTLTTKSYRNKWSASKASGPVFSLLSLGEKTSDDHSADNETSISVSYNEQQESSHDSLMRKYSFESFREAMVNGSPKSILVGDNDCVDCEEYDPSWRATGHTRAAYERHVQPLQRSLQKAAAEEEEFSSTF